MKGIIIYKGKYGATRQYANWLGSILALPVVEAGAETPEQLAEADYIIMGTSIYIGKLQLCKWLKRRRDAIVNKRLFLFLVAGTPSTEREKLQGYLIANISEALRSRCATFFLPGKLEFNKLSRMDKLLLVLGSKLARDSKTGNISLDDYDEVKKEHLDGLISTVKALNELAVK